MVESVLGKWQYDSALLEAETEDSILDTVRTIQHGMADQRDNSYPVTWIYFRNGHRTISVVKPTISTWRRKSMQVVKTALEPGAQDSTIGSNNDKVAVIAAAGVLCVLPRIGPSVFVILLGNVRFWFCCKSVIPVVRNASLPCC